MKNIKVINKYIPWKYTTKLKEHQILENDNYEIDLYSCSCGHEEFIFKKDFLDTSYMCGSCENEYFFDVNELLEDFTAFCKKYEDFDFYFLYDDVKYLNEILIASCYIKIPYEIDFSRNKIYFRKLNIYKIDVNSTGKITNDFLINISKDRLKIMKKDLKNYIKTNNLNFQYFKELENNLYTFLSLRAKKSLLDNDFVYWKNFNLLQFDSQITIVEALSIISNHRKEKSVKKVIYEIHSNSIKNKKDFYPVFINAFTKTIKDPNILIKLLSLNLSNNCTSKELIKFIEFLKNEKYTEKQIYNIFKHEVFVLHFLDDTVRNTIFYLERGLNNFKKVKANITNIHDKLVQCTRKEKFLKLTRQFEK